MAKINKLNFCRNNENACKLLPGLRAFGGVWKSFGAWREGIHEANEQCDAYEKAIGAACALATHWSRDEHFYGRYYHYFNQYQ